MKKLSKSLLAVGLLSACSSSLFAATIALPPSGASDDGRSTIREDTGTGASNVASAWAGSLTGGADLRSILSFVIPILGVGESISSVTLTLPQAAVNDGTGFIDVSVFELTQVAIGGQMSWANYATGSTWTTPGGDFGSELSSVSVNLEGTTGDINTIGSTAAFVSAVESAAGGGFQLMLRAPTQEDNTTRGIAWFTASEVRLNVTTVIPEPSAALLGLFGVAMMLIRRKR